MLNGMVHCLNVFSVFNGIKQESILSPKLFDIDVHVLRNILTSKPMGCSFKWENHNHIYLADDLVFIAPLITQKLITECSSFANT